MSFRDPGRNTHRKQGQLSLDGTVAGLEHNRARGDYVELPVNLGRPGSAPADYLGPVPQGYDPRPGFAAFPQPEYEVYEAGTQQHPTPQLRAQLPELHQADLLPDYNDCLITNDLFKQAIQDCTARPDIPELIPVDNDVRAQGIMNSQNTLEDLVADPFSQDPMQEIEAAFDQQMQEPESPQPPLPPEPEQMYEDQWMMMNRLRAPGMGLGPMT